MIPQIQIFDSIPNQDFNQPPDGFICSHEFYCEKFKSIETPFNYYVTIYIPDYFTESVTKYAIEPAKKGGKIIMDHYNERTAMATQDIYKRTGAKKYFDGVFKVANINWKLASKVGYAINSAITITTSALNPFNWLIS